MQDGKVKYHKAFGNFEYDPKSLPVTLNSIYDLASVTKVAAATPALMKLQDMGKFSPDQTLVDARTHLRLQPRGAVCHGLRIRDDAGEFMHDSAEEADLARHIRWRGDTFVCDKRHR